MMRASPCFVPHADIRILIASIDQAAIMTADKTAAICAHNVQIQSVDTSPQGVERTSGEQLPPSGNAAAILEIA